MILTLLQQLHHAVVGGCIRVSHWSTNTVMLRLPHTNAAA